MIEWRRIPGFSRYEVSCEGQVRRAERIGNWMPGGCSQWKSTNGYFMVDIASDAGVQKSQLVSRLVASAFIRPPLKGEHVRHMDGVPTNNKLENLRYGTALENEADKIAHGTKMQGERHHKRKINDGTAREILRRIKAGQPVREIARQLIVSRYIVSDISRGKTWRHITGGVGLPGAVDC